MSDQRTPEQHIARLKMLKAYGDLAANPDRWKDGDTIGWALARMAEQEARIVELQRFYEMTVANEIRLMRKSGDQQAEIARLRELLKISADKLHLATISGGWNFSELIACIGAALEAK